jgi:hypothetical protein
VLPIIHALHRNIPKGFGNRICAISRMFSRIFPPASLK